MSEAMLDSNDLSDLPRWACVAFVSRCVRRSAPVLTATGVDGVAEVESVLDVADAVAGAARAMGQQEAFRLVDTVDDLELGCRGRRDENYRVASRLLQATKFAAFCLIEDTPNFLSNAEAAYNGAASAACFSSNDDPDIAITNSELTYQAMREDFDRIKSLSQEQAITDDTAVSAAAFGPMWSGATPSWARAVSERGAGTT